MFKSVQELKEFIVWARKQGIKRIKAKGMEIEIADLTIAYDRESALTGQGSEEKDTSKTLVDTQATDEAEEDQDLFWSAN